MEIRKSERKQAKIKLALQGSAGSGKTYSSLLLGKGLTKGDFSKIAIIDTENKSADLYAHLGDYNVVSMGATFTGGVNSFDIYTNLLENNQGESYQLQALPFKDLESMIIPLGLITSAVEEITFTADVMNLPPDIKVFLEDRLQNTFTRLDQENTKYEVTLAETNGAGRFFIHTTQSVLSVSSDALLTSISVYKLNNSKVRIAGLSQGKTTVKLFNILGKQVVNTSFSTNGVNDISLPKLAPGVYIVNVNMETGQLNKKIIIE